MVAGIPGMGDAGRVYTGIYRRYGKYPVYTGIFGVLRPLYGLPAPRRATARRAGPSASVILRERLVARASSEARGPERSDFGCGARARGAARLRLAAADPDLNFKTDFLSTRVNKSQYQLLSFGFGLGTGSFNGFALALSSPRVKPGKRCFKKPSIHPSTMRTNCFFTNPFVQNLYTPTFRPTRSHILIDQLLGYTHRT